MKHLTLKDTVAYRPFLVLFGILTALFATLSILISDVFVPFASAFLAILFLFEQSEKRFVSLTLALVMLIAMPIANPAFVLFALQITLTAAIVVLCFARGRSKAECVLLLTVTTTAFIFLVLLFAAFQKVEEYTLSAALEYYKQLYGELKGTFVDSVSSIVSTMENGQSAFPFTPEMAEEMFNLLATMVISLVVLVGFVFAGITLKLSMALGARLAKDPEPFRAWRFEVPSLYAYFYLTLMLLSFFLKAEGVFGITVLNLYYIFFAVFAYLGLRFSYLTLTVIRRRRGSAVLILAVSLLLFSTVALQILSLVGAYTSISQSRFISQDQKKD